MDIAAFVGFASSGPVDTPVVIEDPGRFDEIFGGDLDLAWDPAQGKMQQSFLGSAVRAFLRNGGRRCWVVRVAQSPATAEFLIPGVLAWTPDSGFVGAKCIARSPGGWAAQIRLNAAVIETSVEAASAQPSELLRLRFANSELTAFRTSASPAVWFRPLLTSEPLAPFASAQWLGTGAPQTVTIAASDWAGGEIELRLAAAAPGIAAGTWLRAGSLFVCLEEVNGTNLRSSRVWRLVPALEAEYAVVGQPVQASVLELNLFSDVGDTGRRRLLGLGLAPEHSRYTGALPDDIEVFRNGAAADSPRFPIACRSDRILLPLGLLSLAGDTFAQMEQPSGLTRLQREGLAAFDAAAFLDPNLSGYGVSTLLDAAFHLQYQVQEPPALRGLHSLLPVEEISIASMPDAVHRPWHDVPPIDTGIPEPPVLAPAFLSGDSVQLEWSAVALSSSYELQSSVAPAFESLVWTRQLSATEDCDDAQDPACGSDRWYRVRARGDWGFTAWSNTEAAPRSRGGYDECDRTLPSPPLLGAPVLRERTEVSWSYEGPAEFLLEVSPEPDFAAADTLYSGPLRTFSFWQAADATRYFRVRAVGGPWSNTVVAVPGGSGSVAVDLPTRDGAEPDANLAQLERLHAGLLTFCAARSDVFAVLALPAHFRERSAREMRDRLLNSPLLNREERTFSFGALYHPWVLARDRVLRAAPPDGAAAGIMAARTLGAGAWVAPANRILAGALALEPPVLDAALRYGERFNIIEQAPAGFLVLNSDTLSLESELRTIGTRRLSILLRRLALSEGNRLVFEPNDERLARRIERQFEEVMNFLYGRRAFAGATPEQAYRVIVRATQDDRDNGRLIVELRFAPAEPMAFLTVRMVETGGTWVVMEGD
jgi:hypothetical protein